MKVAAVGIAFGAASLSSAQYAVGMDALFKALRQNSVIKMTQVLPVGEKPPIPQTRTLPESNENPGELEIVHYGSIGGKGNQIILGDGVEIVNRGYRCMADNIVGDKVTEIFTLSGDVRIIGKDETIVAEAVTINFKTKTFFATYGKAQIHPNLLKNQVTGDIFLSGKQAYGNSRLLHGVDSMFTTCDLPTPHFSLDAEKTTIEPGREAVLKNVKIVVLGKTIINLPILWIPLGERSYKYLPQVGQSPDEGYYIKNTYGFPMRGDDRGAIRLDYMSKLGVGVGANYYYRNRTMNGIAKVYGIFGTSKVVTINNQHEQRLGWATLTVDNDIQRNNYLTAPGSTLMSTRAQLRFPQHTTVGFSQQQQSTTGFNSFNQTITVNDSRRWGRTNTNLDMTLNRSGGSSGFGRSTMDVRFQGSQDVKKGVFSLEYQRTIPIGTVASNFFPSSDKTPVLSFRSDSTKLFGIDSFKTVPFRTEFSIGEYFDPLVKKRISRGMFDLAFNRATRDKGNWRWDFNGDFRQNMYSDDTAQYRLMFGNNLTYAIGKKVALNFRYSYLRPFGYSPLILDRTGTTNIFTTDLSFMKNSKSSFGLQTGYDFVRSGNGEVPWQQIGLRSEYRLGNAYSFRTLTTYDTFQQAWSNIRLDSVWQTPTLSASLSARYDGIQQKWANINAYIDGVQLGKTRIGAVFNYNGYTKKFDSQQYNFVYDLHCAEAVLTIADYGTGFRAGKEIGFFIRLKSIPMDSNFGRGRLGQVLGSGTGRDF